MSREAIFFDSISFNRRCFQSLACDPPASLSEESMMTLFTRNSIAALTFCSEGEGLVWPCDTGSGDEGRRTFAANPPRRIFSPFILKSPSTSESVTSICGLTQEPSEILSQKRSCNVARAGDDNLKSTRQATKCGRQLGVSSRNLTPSHTEGSEFFSTIALSLWMLIVKFQWGSPAS